MIKPGTYKGVMTTHDLSRATEMIGKIYDGNVLTSYSARNQYTNANHIYWEIELELIEHPNPQPFFINRPLEIFSDGDVNELKSILKFTSEVNDDTEVILAKDSDLDTREIINVLSHMPPIWRVKKKC